MEKRFAKAALLVITTATGTVIADLLLDLNLDVSWTAASVLTLVALSGGTGYVFGLRQGFESGKAIGRLKAGLNAYRQDVVADLKWQWTWIDGNPHRFLWECPECGFDVELKESEEGVYVSCPSCGYDKRWDLNEEELKTRVQKEIWRRVKAGERLSTS